MVDTMRTESQQIGKGIVEEVLDDAISDEEMDFLLAEDHDEINALLQEAYGAKARGESATLEPLHVLLAEERARFLASQG
jgi:hypothetical protein